MGRKRYIIRLNENQGVSLRKSFQTHSSNTVGQAKLSTFTPLHP